jgi:hypothetical protein
MRKVVEESRRRAPNIMVLRKCGGGNDALSRGIVKEMRLKLVGEPMLVVAWFTSHVKGIEVALPDIGSLLSRHEDMLNLSEGRVLVEPFALC